MIGLVLAAGVGRRLMPYTQDVPKTLLSVADGVTILDVILGNLAACGLTEIAVVVGHVAGALERRVPDLERSHGVHLRLIYNDRFHWNNAYSLWLARDAIAGGALLVNGDTMHPVAVEQTLLANRGAGVLLAVDTVRDLTDESMKVELDDTDRIVRITKDMPAEAAHGEYLGASLVEAFASAELAACLAETWQGDPDLYYENGLQLLAERTGMVRASRIGSVDWVEVDDLADLARAREIACRS